VKIANLDALHYLRGLPDSSVDLLVTDPPYFRVKGEPWDRAWDTPSAFVAWLGIVADEWRRVLKPNGSLYCFASPKMAARVEVMLGERFNVLNGIAWNKGDAGIHRRACKEELRAYFPATERIVFCEQYGADNAAKGEAGYVAKCDELRGLIFEPLRAYLVGERDRAGFASTAAVDAEWQKMRGSKGRMAGHWFGVSQWELPAAEDPYTDAWTFKTVQAGRGKHSCAKPWDMAIHIVNASSRPGAVVCDPFCGSGVFLEAAAALEREAWGNDGCKHWADVTRRAVASPRPIGQGRLL